ncbi:hypothetical protein GCM10023086_06360 [Streptomyces venetus]|uniref:Nucleotidyltransferase family protein n=1 Tax=Streptomyces venetus TaxID=1701086 RepID=A0ABP8F3L1_9ACTN
MTERSERENAWRLLGHVCTADLDPRAAAAAAELLSGPLDVDELISQAARHALLPALAAHVIEVERTDLFPLELRRHLIDSLYWNRHKTALATAEALRIGAAADASGMSLACTKGVVCQFTTYGGRGVRAFGDIDLMAHPDDREKVAALLGDLGYSGAVTYDHKAGRVVELGRADKALYRLHRDHLPHFLRVTEGESIPFHVVDVAFSLTWQTSGWQLPMDEVLADLEQVAVPGPSGGDVLPALAVPYDFLFLVLHLFREAWFQRTILKKNVRLGQFADICRFWWLRGRDHAAEISRLVAAHGLQPPIAWVCHHTDAVFGSALVAELGLDGYVAEDWVNSAGATDGSGLAWRGSMRDRLRDRVPPQLTAAPLPSLARAVRA